MPNYNDKFSTLLDLIEAGVEKSKIIELCKLWEITEDDTKLLLKCVKEESLIKTSVATMVPLSLLYNAGVPGFSAIGITTGLKALSLGLGMVPGIGVCVLTGLAVYKLLK